MSTGAANVKLDTTELDRLAASLGIRKDRVLSAIALEVEAEVKNSIQPGHYRPYKRTKEGLLHWSTSPGQPPAMDTSALKNSIHTEKINDGLYWMADGVEYGIWLETGTSRMQARPFMVPAIEKMAKKFELAWTRLLEVFNP